MHKMKIPQILTLILDKDSYFKIYKIKEEM